ncbi:hypothetical protein BCR43DRAFT_113758 [Syncephalastrum racemosum]|uniref:Uncharacterized protein n=1 Tax=Syncephalastrum racemosum TaxID=13706 RepID=A0A1X2H085_SYNRA|nr:hypothetical protein BCR43DRAFT_113758 [Syncephalastrum racemosum]
MPVSSRAELERSRTAAELLHPTGVRLEQVLFGGWVAAMHAIIAEGGDDPAPYREFFFVSWATGIKTPVDPTHVGSNLRAPFPDIRWETLDPSLVFLDHGVEVVPTAVGGNLVGLVGARVTGNPSDHYTMKTRRGKGGLKQYRRTPFVYSSPWLNSWLWARMQALEKDLLGCSRSKGITK